MRKREIKKIIAVMVATSVFWANTIGVSAVSEKEGVLLNTLSFNSISQNEMFDSEETFEFKDEMLQQEFGFTKKERLSEEGNYVVLMENEQSYQEIVNEYGGEIKNEYAEYKGNVVTMDLTDAETEQLEDIKGVVSVEENIVLTGLTSDMEIIGLSEILEQSDISMKHLMENELEQWYLDAIGIDESLQKQARKKYKEKQKKHKKSGKGEIKIELLDSGVSYTEDIDIAERVNLIPGEEEVSVLYEDAGGHGTSLAGIIGANDNEEGITGINPDANIYSVKVLDAENRATLSRIIEGIYWGIENDMSIINMSFGTSVDSPALHQAIRDAYDAGILLVAAAGNVDCKEVLYPAAYPEVVAVGAIDTTGKRIEEYANGKELEILAPGDGILGTGLFDGVVMGAGTSASAAQVSAVASLIWSKDTSVSADFIRQLLKRTGKRVENAEGVGLINAKQAFNSFDKFKKEYKKSDLNEKKVTVTSVESQEYSEAYEDVLVVNGLWYGDKHAAIVTDYLNNPSSIGNDAYGYLNSNRVTIMAVMAKAADKNIFQKYVDRGSALHGTGNYKIALRYLYDCAQNVRSGMTPEAASKAAQGSMDLGGSIAGESLIWGTEKMLNTDMSEISSNENLAAVRYFKVLGFALHCLQDTFAHRSVIQTADEGYFRKSDFTNWQAFWSEVKEGSIECREISDYVRAGIYDKPSRIYTDNPDFVPMRFQDAKKASALMLKAALLKTGYSSTWFTAPKYGTKLGGVTTYSDTHR